MNRESLENDLKALELRFAEITKLKTESDTKSQEYLAELYRIQGENRYIQEQLAKFPPEEDVKLKQSKLDKLPKEVKE